MIYSIVITPLETLFDWIFSAVHSSVPSIGMIGTIAVLSLCVNFLALPLYNMADRIQEDERRVTKGMQRWVLHIKRTFRGDERFMMLSELYRQNNYHPIYALRSALSVLIQVPFFMAAYHYLRSNELLKDAAFLCIKDLSSPDSLINIKIAGNHFSLNLLPFVMTAVNCISGSIYAKDFTLREKIQVYALAAVFLVLLYNSPSGLVIYWTFNNIFSLAKNLIRKNLKSPRQILIVLSAFLILFVHLISIARFGYKKKILIIFAYILAAFCIVYPRLLNVRCFASLVKWGKSLFISFATNFKKLFEKMDASKPSFPLALLSGLAMAILCGLVLPSSVIASSPTEFSFLGNTASPLSYVKTAFLINLGFFVFWPIAIYKLSGQRIRFVVQIALSSIVVFALFNVYLFKCNWGDIDATFNVASLDILTVPSPLYKLIPLEILFASVFAFAAAHVKKRNDVVAALLFALCLGMTALSFVKIKTIRSGYEEYAANLKKNNASEEDGAIYHLSKTGRNVIVLFLDQAVGQYVDAIFEEYPDIKKNFDGFTWYPNTVSFDAFTLQGSPPIYGGYEYNQEGMNAREDELLREKNSEAHLVAAKLFADGGYSATLTDPPSPNYTANDYSGVYDKHPEVKVIGKLKEKYLDDFLKEKGVVDSKRSDKTCKRQIVSFSFLQSLPPFLRMWFYTKIHALPVSKKLSDAARRWLTDFSQLYFLPRLTDFMQNSKNGAFIIIHSEATHDVGVCPDDDLEAPAVPQPKIILSPVRDFHYKVDAAALKQLGKYFEYLRKNACYDNTRIIVVSDHGSRQERIKQWASFKDFELMCRNGALLMSKDFGCRGDISVDNTFMTNADTLFLAKKGLGLSDINPFTGKKLEPQKKGGVVVYHLRNHHASYYRKKTQFEIDKTRAWHVSGDIFEEKNWIPLLEWEKSHGGTK